ncbi:MAG: HEAT repeat domain-containing protein [Candidatus Eisenbacteria bacterium]|uniref:HEAT repeat domain-containing protein n=1 Tax=Eiseniibacteriota bacterium TaxID=2212470 RepID=A0A849SSL1_UNCEI|nr:HEAT repeat domain-containing protein [Candidatus Eisenbacteria bacterium]
MSDDKIGAPRSTDVLNSRGLSGKREYIRGLEQRRDEEALSLLVECLCDESWYLRELAEESLLRIGESCSPVLLPLLEQGLWFTRASSARVLGRFARREAIPGLLRLREDSNASVADAALDALVRIGRHGGAAATARGLQDLGDERRLAALEQLGARDRALRDRIERLAAHDEITHAASGADLSDDSPAVKALEEGLEWEVLTSPTRHSPPRKAGESERSESGGA